MRLSELFVEKEEMSISQPANCALDKSQQYI